MSTQHQQHPSYTLPVLGPHCRYLPPECFVIGKDPPKISSKVSVPSSQMRVGVEGEYFLCEGSVSGGCVVCWCHLLPMSLWEEGMVVVGTITD